MTGAANRRRGADAERAVVNYLRANGYPDARRTLAGDGRQPGDIDFAPGIHLEVKDVASSAWPSWRYQAVTECRGRIPIVVRRTRGSVTWGRGSLIGTHNSPCRALGCGASAPFATGITAPSPT